MSERELDSAGHPIGGRRHNGSAPRGMNGEPREMALPRVMISRSELELVRRTAHLLDDTLANFIRDSIFDRIKSVLEPGDRPSGKG